jgi:hypothetical protein
MKMTTMSTTAVRHSKSRLMSGAQCAKRLWLEMHEPWRAEIDAGVQTCFATGHRMGEIARSLYPEGRLQITPKTRPPHWWRCRRHAVLMSLSYDGVAGKRLDPTSYDGVPAI